MTNNYICHYGVKGMKWGVRHDKSSGNTRFVSGSSKTQFKDSGYYRKRLSKPIRKELNSYMKSKDKIVVGDAPGIDRQVQDYLKKKKYKNVEIYGPGKKVRYSADKRWKTRPIDDPKHEPMSPKWLAKKDKAMTKVATSGLAIVLDQGAQATRNNVKRLLKQGKMAKVFELSIKGKKYDKWVKVGKSFLDNNT